MIKAAGILFVTKDGRVLLLQRNYDSDAPGTWGIPGGKIEEDETAQVAAIRETLEEVDWVVGDDTPIDEFARRIKDGVDWTTFKVKLTDAFDPVLNDEHIGFTWCKPGDHPEPLHPGCRVLLDKLTMHEYDIAKAMSVGELASPQTYENVTLFDIRITGTGTAYRKALKEFVYRKPSNYLNQEFLDRCSGLPVILEHPPNDTLDSDEFGDRIVGTVLLPYIKGDEVWGIAKIYDTTTIKMMREDKLSTSPSVVFRDAGKTPTNEKVSTDEGDTILIEGKPSLLDHIAICKRGVWDKGGKPAGVISETTEDKKMADPADKTETMDDAAEGETDMSKLMKMCDSINTRLDSLEGKKKADADGEDSDEEKAAKAQAELEKKKAEEKEDVKDESDDDGKKGEPMPAAADKDVAEIKADTADLKKRFADFEKANKEETEEERVAKTEAQSRADAVAHAFGDAAPRPMQGETLLGYRRRLVSKFKKHSEDYKDIDITGAEGPMLAIIEKRVYADAMTAALHPTDLPDGQLREIVMPDRTGRRISTFHGKSPNIWLGDFKSPKRYLQSINKEG